MTPELKAAELVDKYWKINTNNDYWTVSLHLGKKMAKIAIDEIINELVKLSNGEFTFIREVEYWQEVKHEIDKYKL